MPIKFGIEVRPSRQACWIHKIVRDELGLNIGDFRNQALQIQIHTMLPPNNGRDTDARQTDEAPIPRIRDHTTPADAELRYFEAYCQLQLGENNIHVCHFHSVVVVELNRTAFEMQLDFVTCRKRPKISGVVFGKMEAVP